MLDLLCHSNSIWTCSPWKLRITYIVQGSRVIYRSYPVHKYGVSSPKVFTIPVAEKIELRSDELFILSCFTPVLLESILVFVLSSLHSNEDPSLEPSAVYKWSCLSFTVPSIPSSHLRRFISRSQAPPPCSLATRSIHTMVAWCNGCSEVKSCPLHKILLEFGFTTTAPTWH